MSVEEDISALRQDFQKHLQRDVEMHSKIAVTAEIVERIEGHMETQNGQFVGIKEAQLRQEGAFGMLKWVMGFVFVPLVAVGVTITGIVLGYLINGG